MKMNIKPWYVLVAVTFLVCIWGIALRITQSTSLVEAAFVIFISFFFLVLMILSVLKIAATDNRK